MNARYLALSILCCAVLGACEGGVGAPPAAPSDSTTPPSARCGDEAHSIQNLRDDPGLASEERELAIEAVVTRNFRQGLGGFFVETAAGERAGAASAGLFIDASGLPDVKVSAGQRVRVLGTAHEIGPQGGTVTTLIAARITSCSGATDLPPPITIDAPLDAAAWEKLEGQRVRLPGPLTVIGNHELQRLGQLHTSLAGRQFQITERFPPGPEAEALAQKNQLAQVLLDDGRSREFPRHLWFLDPAPLGATNPWRVGTVLRDVEGIVDQREGVYRVQLTRELDHAEQAPRPDTPPAVGGDITVAALNVLNFFNGDGGGGGFPTTRGASDAEELARQRDKTVRVILALKPDVAALMEVENDGYGPDSAIADLVDALHAAGGDDYRFVAAEQGRVGGDEIGVALIYRQTRVKPVGAAMVRETSAFQQRNRVPLAQTFQPIAKGGKPFTVVANHLKSKGGCTEAEGDDVDRHNGQSCWNRTRVIAAQELLQWLPARGKGDVVLLGDFNAYAQEEPLRVLRGDGYVDLIGQYVGDEAYSFVWAAQSGRLDHALGNPSFAKRVTGAAEWHINADELELFDYNREHKSDEQVGWGAATPYRASDHDPLIVGVKLK